MPLHIQCPCIGRTLTIRHKKPHERTNLKVLKDTFARVASSTKSTSKAFLKKAPLSKSKACPKPDTSKAAAKLRKKKTSRPFFTFKKKNPPSLSTTVFTAKPDLMTLLSPDNLLHSLEKEQAIKTERPQSPFNTSPSKPLIQMKRQTDATSQNGNLSKTTTYPVKLPKLDFERDERDTLTSQNTHKNTKNAVPPAVFLASNAKSIQQYLFWKRYQKAHQKLGETGFFSPGNALKDSSKSPFKVEPWPEVDEHYPQHNLSQLGPSLSGSTYRLQDLPNLPGHEHEFSLY